MDTSLLRCLTVVILFMASSEVFLFRDEPEEEGEPIHGHVNSISVLRSYRRLGLAKKLMLLSRAFPTAVTPSLTRQSCRRSNG